ARIGQQIDLAEALLAIDRVRNRAGSAAELPALLAHDRLEDRHRNDAVELFELAENDRAVRVGTRERDVEVIASALGGKAALTGRSRTSIRRDPIAKNRLGGHEAPTGHGGVVPLAVPH